MATVKEWGIVTLITLAFSSNIISADATLAFPQFSPFGNRRDGYHKELLAFNHFPPLSDNYVNDTAQIFSPGERQELRAQLQAFHNRTGKQIMVVTINSVRDYSSTDSLERFATRLFNHRGIGDRSRNDGVMVLVVPGDRKVRIELGAGYDRSWDGRMQQIIDSQMIPEFRQGRLASGTRNGVNALFRQFESVTSAPRPSSPRQPASKFPVLSDNYINDIAQVLPQGERQKLHSQLQAFYNRTGRRIIVVTIRSIRDYSSGDTFESFATQLFNQQGVNDPIRNHGVMLLVTSNEQRVRIQLGASYDRSLDIRMQGMIDNQIAPELRQGRFTNGIQTGVSALLNELGTLPAVPLRPESSLLSRENPLPGGWFGFFLGGLAFVGGGFMALIAILSKPKCGRCGSKKLKKLPVSHYELAQHLTSGQLKEHELGSIKYALMQCSDCSNINIRPRNQMFSSYSRCPQCKHKTLKTTSLVLTDATTSSEGEKEIIEECQFCSYRTTRIEIIPMLSERDHDSSSSFDRDSDSGGSSSGGGASGSW